MAQANVNQAKGNFDGAHQGVEVGVGLDAEKLKRDLAEGLVSEDAARLNYGLSKQ